MISLVSLAVEGPSELLLTFSDESFGTWSAAEVIARDTVSDPSTGRAGILCARIYRRW